MYKNQLQELAQRSCFNLPSYACIREGPDHASRFKATVNFNGEIFESPSFCSTLRQAEHAAAEVALNILSSRGPSRSLAAKVLDETGVCKNLLQETAHRAGLRLPVYTTVRSGPGHIPVFTCTVELAGMSFNGEPAKTKKQAQKNAAMTAWSALKQLPSLSPSPSPSSSSASLEPESNEEQEQVTIARVLANLHPKEVNKPSTQTESKRVKRKPAPVRRDMNASSSLSMYPVPYPTWTYSGFSPQLPMYHQMWQQEQASQQSHLLTLPSPPSGARITPFIQSVFQPSHNQYFAAREQELVGVRGITVPNPSSSLLFSNHPSPVPIRSRSYVTIQEIAEEKCQGEEEWIHNRRINLQSRPVILPPNEAQNPPVDIHNEPEHLQESQEDKSKNGGPGISNLPADKEPNIGHSILKSAADSSPTVLSSAGENAKIQETPVEGNRKEQFDWVHAGSVHDGKETGFMAGSSIPGHSPFLLRKSGGSMCDGKEAGFMAGASIPSRIPFQSQKSRGSYSSHVNPITHRPPSPSSSGMTKCFRPRPSSLAAPVTIRTAVPVCSSTPRAVTARQSANLMAPAVQVRSVIPVCSSPSTRNIPDSGNEAVKAQKSDVTSVENLELGNLQI
ncbi:hypothetical protein AAC387_Pa09g0410 [Persea americana]